MSRPHIVIVSPLYPPHLGGVEKYSRSLAAELSGDCDVTVFCMNTEGSPDTFREGVVTVHALPCFPLLHGRFPIPRASAIRRLKAWFRENRPDFAIVQCRFYLLSWVSCRILSENKIPFIQIEHGAGDIRMANPVVNFVWHLYESILTRSEKRIPHDYYGVSGAAVRWLRHFGIEGKGVLSNAVAPVDFSGAVPGDWRKAHGIPEDGVLITFSGRIMKEKGILDLLMAFDGLKGERLYLAAAGSGEMDLVKPWRDRPEIFFLGQIPAEEIPSLMADTQIFCLPSHFIEGQPTVILEAGVCGAAVVATANGGITEVIPDERFGVLVKSGDTEALREALQDLVDHPEKRETLGAALRERILERFTWKTTAARVLEAKDRALS